MRVLITGSQGKIGRVVTRMAVEEGYDLRTFDRIAAPQEQVDHIPGDLLDPFAVRRAVMGCDAIVHAGAIPNDRTGQSDLVFTTNVTGTWHVLQAAAEAQVKKIIYFSSVNALGIWGGARRPDYLPIDDAHPPYPRPAYGLSKHVGEQMCESFTRWHRASTYCLRPCLVVDEDWGRWRSRDPERMRRWLVGDYYSYVDVRDVARAVLGCLKDTAESRHGRYLLTAADNAAGLPTEQILREDFADIPWRAAPDYLDRPDKSLVDTSAARRDFGWEPIYSRTLE
ncbi:MAG TPA: NAD(P)-dependent oxidoreductase [Armatimonadota bacterium]|nr:NAD(P)-dependent oxidoreductase [Armatimonadota bacterium]